MDINFKKRQDTWTWYKNAFTVSTDEREYDITWFIYVAIAIIVLSSFL